MSQRSQRISALLRESIQKVISKGLQDPRVRGLITVTKVTTADDLSQATVYVSVMPAEHADLTMHGLKAAAGHIRRQAGTKLSLSKLPQLIFKLDTTTIRQAGVLDAIAKVAREREERELAEQQSEGADETHHSTEESAADER
jgi:ribosome-binding factor A